MHFSTGMLQALGIYTNSTTFYKMVQVMPSGTPEHILLILTLDQVRIETKRNQDTVKEVS